MKKNDYTHQFTHLILELKKDFPQYTLGRHLSTAFADYGDTWNMRDSEVVFALEKYKTILDIDFVPPQDVEQIIADAQNLDLLLEDDYEDDDL